MHSGARAAVHLPPREVHHQRRRVPQPVPIAPRAAMCMRSGRRQGVGSAAARRTALRCRASRVHTATAIPTQVAKPTVASAPPTWMIAALVGSMFVNLLLFILYLLK